MAVNQGSIIQALESICKDIDPSEFIYQFLSAYGAAKTTISRLRDGSRNIANTAGDTGVKKQLYFRPVDKGEDVYACAEALKSESVIAANDIRFVIVTDFDSLVAFDLKADESLDTDIHLLDKQYAFFLPLIAGYEKAVMYSEHPADIKASEKMGQLYDLIRERNELSKSEDIHALNVFLTRLLFCFYAEDTGIFGQDQMTKAIESTTSITGEDLDQFFKDLFTALNLPDGLPEKAKLAAHFQAFPYVNGGLFKADEPIPEFSTKARRILLECGSLSWAEINPDIFGSMFQAVIDQEQRGNLGQHYTSVSNIMKVIKPLFLDKLWDALDQARGREKKLKDLLVRLQNIRVFDPACGSGNFLIIAYKELRKIEMAMIDALNEVSAQPEMYYSGISLAQFYGIEIDDFAHEVAILSLWLAEHQMNVEFKDKFGYANPILPLTESGNIVAGNALRMDWQKLCPAKNESNTDLEIYICGNPPFLGFSNRTEAQQDDLDIVFSRTSNYRKLDYVAAWYQKGAEYLVETNSELAFVATKSIFQGEQTAWLWEPILSSGIVINFAYQPFKWKNSAKDNAQVYVSIVGISAKARLCRFIFQVENGALVKRSVKRINPYLVEADSVFVSPVRDPLSAEKRIVLGSSPKDNGALLMSLDEKEDLLSKYPEYAKYVKQYVGTDEFLYGKYRFCLWLKHEPLSYLQTLPLISDRLKKVSDFRSASKKKATQKSSETPHLFDEDRQQIKGEFILVPYTTSERREYLPMAFLNSEVVVSNLANMVIDGGLYELGILSSTMCLAWMRAVGGRLENRVRFSGQLVYNTFPWPDKPSDEAISTICRLAENIILIREDYPEKTPAELYDPAKMPAPLLKSHKSLDIAVEKLYRDKPFKDTSERLEHLFGLYEQLIAREKKGA